MDAPWARVPLVGEATLSAGRCKTRCGGGGVPESEGGVVGSWYDARTGSGAARAAGGALTAGTVGGPAVLGLARAGPVGRRE